MGWGGGQEVKHPPSSEEGRPWETVNLTQELLRDGVIYVTSKAWDLLLREDQHVLNGLSERRGRIIIFVSFAAAATEK